MQQTLARELERRTARRVRVGMYKDVSTSLHIYGQDAKHLTGEGDKVKSFFERHDCAKFKAMSMASAFAGEMPITCAITRLTSAGV